MILYTSPDFSQYHLNYPIISSHKVGGIHTKMSTIAAALNCGVISDVQGVQDNLIIEPLGVKSPHSDELHLTPDEWRAIQDQRINQIKEYPYRKILLCTEMELIRWPGETQKSMFEAVNGKIFASTYYHQALFRTVGIDAPVIYEPVNEFLYYPTKKNAKQIITTGTTKHIKNTQMIIDVYRALEGQGYHRVHIGSPIMWDFDWHESKVKKDDMRLYHELEEVCDEFYDASSSTFVAQKMSESAFYLNFAYHEVSCRTACEAIMAGCGVIGGEHPLWKEYPALGSVRTPEECVAVIVKHTGDKDRVSKMRDYAVSHFGFEAFRNNIKEAFNEN